MTQIILRNVSLAYGDGQLLDRASLVIDKGQRIGVIGRNGEGKSTLLKIIAGEVLPDDGDVQLSQDQQISYLEQNPIIDDEISVYDYVATGLGMAGDLLRQYQKNHESIDQDQMLLDPSRSIQSELSDLDGWSLEIDLVDMLHKLSLPHNKPISSLSGGWQKRAQLAKALVNRPNILLLDEPTNHIDFETLSWLEKQLRKYIGTIIFVTHDRQFLDVLATHIVELDRGILTKWPGNYEHYRIGKSLQVEVQERHYRQFIKKLAKEEKWIRDGIKARRTRNEGRVRRLKELRKQRSNIRNSQANLKLELNDQNKSGNLIIEAKHINYQIDQQPIIHDFSVRILRGDRISLIGPNGIGKTTLLNLLLKQIEPDSGSLRHGKRIQIACFDQFRSVLKPEKTVIDTVSEGRNYITTNERSRHIMSYLSDFLFTSRRANSPISSLSGGERARVLLAKLFSKPFNLLVMDEPTNDLDTDTLELLEEMLLDFQGTLLMVSHDRRFIDNVVTSTLVFEGNGFIREYAGGYSDWLQQTKIEDKLRTLEKNPPHSPSRTKSTRPTPKKKSKPSYREQQELDKLPSQIEAMEDRLEKLAEQISRSDFYQQDSDSIRETNNEIAEIQQELERCYSRWSELEARFAK
ncbi:MAG: ATP-binding cassette domain-containing protein [Gammaproteobacteria bacterium]|nr:ATP-binding cassette domain-containing protein [Gammaproteobacteria bacterium]MCY4275284.1 ATP-binding cassette domain-containing protein [Gammaproteobacteria bacterium]